MAGLNCEIKWETRLCEVNGELGYFHCWEHWANVIGASALRGGHPGGQVGQIYGIVEFPERIARLEQMLNKAIEGADDIVFDENDKPLIFERKDVPKEIGQLRPVGVIDISRELELIKKYEEKTMSGAWHPCRYVDLKLEHDGSWVDGRWYEWEDIHGNREVARMKLDAIDHFYPQAKVIKEEDVCRYRELEENT